MTFLMDMLSFAFIRRALLVGIFVSLCAALLGVSLVLKRFSMIGDGLSHVSFGALSVALAFGWAPLKFSFRLLRLPPSSCSALPNGQRSRAMQQLRLFPPPRWQSGLSSPP